MTCLHPSSITAGTATARSDHRPADLTLASVLDYHGHGHPSQKCAVRTCIRPRLPQALRLGHGQPFVRVRELASVLDYHRHCDLGRGAQGHLPCVLHPSSITTGTATATSSTCALASVLDYHRHCDFATASSTAFRRFLHPSSIATGTATTMRSVRNSAPSGLHPSSIATGTATLRARTAPCIRPRLPQALRPIGWWGCKPDFNLHPSSITTGTATARCAGACKQEGKDWFHERERLC